MNRAYIKRLKNGPDIGVVVMHKNEIRCKSVQPLFCRCERIGIRIDSDNFTVGINSIYDVFSMPAPAESSVNVHPMQIGDQ